MTKDDRSTPTSRDSSIPPYLLTTHKMSVVIYLPRATIVVVFDKDTSTVVKSVGNLLSLVHIALNSKLPTVHYTVLYLSLDCSIENFSD